MKKTTLELINDLVARSQNFPNSKIQYNFEVPEGLEADNFYGVPAEFSPMVTKGNAVLTYKLQ